MPNEEKENAGKMGTLTVEGVEEIRKSVREVIKEVLDETVPEKEPQPQADAFDYDAWEKKTFPEEGEEFTEDKAVSIARAGVSLSRDEAQKVIWELKQELKLTSSENALLARFTFSLPEEIRGSVLKEAREILKKEVGRPYTEEDGYIENVGLRAVRSIVKDPKKQKSILFEEDKGAGTMPFFFMPENDEDKSPGGRLSAEDRAAADYFGISPADFAKQKE